GQHLSYAKNKNYWQSGLPYLDAILVSVGLDAQTMVTRFEAGAFDTMKTAPLRDFVRLKADPQYGSLVHPPTGASYVIGVNTTIPKLENKKARQPRSWAFDRRRFAELIMLGTVQPKSLPWSPNTPAYEASKDQFFTFDLDRSRGLLHEAGVSNL